MRAGGAENGCMENDLRSLCERGACARGRVCRKATSFCSSRTLHAAMVSLFCFIVHCDVSKYALRSPSACVFRDEKNVVLVGAGMARGGKVSRRNVCACVCSRELLFYSPQILPPA